MINGIVINGLLSSFWNRGRGINEGFKKFWGYPNVFLEKIHLQPPPPPLLPLDVYASGDVLPELSFISIPHSIPIIADNHSFYCTTLHLKF